MDGALGALIDVQALLSATAATGRVGGRWWGSSYLLFESPFCVAKISCAQGSCPVLRQLL